MSLTSFNPDILSIVPEWLASMPRWLLWSAEPNGDKKPKKTPRYARTKSNRYGELGGEKDLSQMVTLQEALNLCEDGYGVGFAFIKGDNITGVDIDNCIDLETGEQSDRSQAIIDYANSYTEYSPSNTGVHIITRGETVSANCKILEIYSQGRFFCFTGRVFGDLKPINDPPNDFFERIHNTIKAEKQAKIKEHKEQTTRTTAPHSDESNLVREALTHIPASIMNDEWVSIGMALKSKFGEQGLAIWDEWSRTCPDKYPSEQEMNTRWRSFRREGVTLGTLYHMAKSYGWEPPVKHRARVQQVIDEPSPEPAQEHQPDPAEHCTALDHATPSEDDDEPIDFVTVVKPPEFPVELMPSCVGDFIQDQSEIIGCDPGAIGISAIIAMASAIDDCVKLRPTRHTRWKERACLWGMFVGLPGDKKSPGMDAALRPSKELDKELNTSYQRAYMQYQEDKDHYDNAPKGAKPDKPTPPKDIRHIAQMSTIEALQNIVSDNERGILVVRDELMGWFGSMDAYSKGGSASKDRALWLELYNGGDQRVDTIARGSKYISNWSASLIGSTQPEAIAKVIKSLPEDGLLQRFMICCASGVPSTGVDRPETNGIYEEYRTLIRSLYYNSSALDTVVLSDEALRIKEEVYTWARKLINTKVVLGGLAGYVGKFEGLYARLLLVFHMAENHTHDIPTEVSVETAAKVATFLKHYLYAHAFYFYREIAGTAGKEYDIARSAALAILKSKSIRVNSRSLSHTVYQWRKLQEVERAAVMAILDSHGWVTPGPIKPSQRMPRYWTVNPKVHTAFKHLI